MNNSPVSLPAIIRKIEAIYFSEPWIRQPSKFGRGDGKSRPKKTKTKKNNPNRKKETDASKTHRTRIQKEKNTRMLALRYNETRTKTAGHTNPKAPNNPIPTYFPFAQTAHVRIVKITEGR
jgi:hypothetical protein